jgi:TolB-like protein
MLRFVLPALIATMMAPEPAFAARVAVLYFQNQGNPTLEPLKVGLAQMLVTDLVGKPNVTVVERQQLQAVLDELQLAHRGVVDPATAVRVAKLVGADHVVMGGYFELAGTFRLDARVVRTETGVVAHAKGLTGKTSDFQELEQALAEDLARWFRTSDTPGVPADPPQGADLRPPATPEGTGATGTRGGDAVGAALAYSEGLIFLDQREPSRARASFEKAVAADPALDDARAALAAMGS